ncbi:MAG: alpha/beta fold hydrolase [Actinomycetota bacterium]
MPYAGVEGTRLWYEAAGKGAPVVFVHGGLADSRLWDAQWKPFAAKHRAIRYDIRGYGRSEEGDLPASYTRDLGSLLEFLEIEKVAVIGLSMGGGIALQFALDYADMVSALVLVGTSLPGFERSPEVDAWLEEEEAAIERGDIAAAVESSLRFWTVGPKRVPEQVDPSVLERVREMSTKVYANPPDESQIEEPDEPAMDRLEDVLCQSLAIVGSEDIERCHQIAKVLCDRMPVCRTHVIEGGAHHLPMEQPAEFNRVALSFLERAAEPY